jgi:imidazolonepropionase-like amidohydrolase
MSSNRAGSQTLSVGADGEIRFEFEFNDRGRGPKLSTRIVLDAAGLPRLLETTGNDYLKRAVEERFSIEGGRAAWKNPSESGGKPVSGKAFYVSMNSAPGEAALLAQALLSAPDQTLALLPEGEARIERVGEMEARAGEEARKVVHYAVSGLGLTPSPIWLEQDGTFFFLGSAWFAVIREGWEPVIPALIQAQDDAEAARFAALARTLARKPAGPVAFRNAIVFDSEAAVARRSSTVIVSGERIEWVGPDADAKIPEDAEVIDATGKTLLPGLWDMHVHLGGAEEGLLHLAAGVTSVRDLANDLDKVLQTRRKFDEGSLLGPRIVLAGFIDGPGPFQGPTKVLADTEEEIRAAIDRYAGLGYQQIKAYSSVKPELVPPLIEHAHKLGLRVSGHIPNAMTAEQCVRLGFDEIQHMNFVFLNFLADPALDTRTPARFTAVAENGAALDLDSDRVRGFIALLRERKTVLDPTLSVFEGLFTDRPGQIGPGFAPVASRLPPQVRRGLLAGGLPVPEGKDETYRASFSRMLQMLRRLHEAGVPILAGTDGFAGFTLHRELELYVQAGLPVARVLQLATLDAARVAARAAELGSIAPGKLADLVLIDGRPLEDIAYLRKGGLVLKGGVVLKTAELYRALRVQP